MAAKIESGGMALTLADGWHVETQLLRGKTRGPRWFWQAWLTRAAVPRAGWARTFRDALRASLRATEKRAARKRR